MILRARGAVGVRLGLGVRIGVVVRFLAARRVRILIHVHGRAVGGHVEPRHVGNGRHRSHHLGDLGRALGDRGDCALVVDAGRVAEEVRLVGDGLVEGVHGLLHLAAGHVGLAEVRVQLVARVGLHVELQRALVGGHGVGRTVERHEAHAEVEQRLRGIGVGLVERGLAKRHAGLGRLAQLQQRVAHARVGLVRRVVLGVGHGDLEVLDGVLVIMQRGVGHAEVVVHRAARVVGRIGGRLRVGVDGLVRVLELDQAVADLVVQQPHLAGCKRAARILQALRVGSQGALEVLARVRRPGLLE